MSREFLKRPEVILAAKVEQSRSSVSDQVIVFQPRVQTPEQIQRAEDQRIQRELALQRQLETRAKERVFRNIRTKKVGIQRAQEAKIAAELKTRDSEIQHVRQEQKTFHSSFVKTPVQLQTLQREKTSSIQAQEARVAYQTAITPEIVQRMVANAVDAKAFETRAAQPKNDLTSRAEWFNTELPVLRAQHNNPDQPFLDGERVFRPMEQQALTLGKTYTGQRVSSGFIPKDASRAILNIQRKPDRDAALTGLLAGINPKQSDYSSIQRLISQGEHELEVQRLAFEETASSRASFLASEQANPKEANSGISERIKAKLGSGFKLPENVRANLETGLNTDLSSVNIHTDAQADMLAKSINATAFTTGKDIFFQTGKYEPNTKSGYELIAHEVTHTVQQANGQVKPGIDADSSLETAAQSKAAQLAAKFDTNTKITNVKPVPRSRITSPKTALAFQREAASSSAKLDVNKLDAAHKLLEAIKHAPLGESVKQQILGAVSLQSLGIFALVFGLGAFAQFTPVGWAADLIIAGLIAFGAYSVGSIIFDVIKDFGAFAQTAVNAKTEDDLKRAGHHFSDAVAKIGVNVVIALIAHSASKGVNARVKSSTTSRNPTSPAAIQTKLDAIKQNPEAVNKPVETTQKPVSSNKPNQSSAKPGQTKAEYKTEQQQARVQGFDPKTRTDAQLAKDIDPKPRPSETPKQAKARVEAAEKEIELRKAMNSSGLTREFISAFKTKEIAQKTAITYNKYGNWAAIKPKIGRPMSQADAKALGYLYASIEGKSKYYLAGEDASKVPQVMENDKGTAFVPSEATYRLANSSLYKKNVEAANAALTGVSDRLIANSQLHHLIGDSVWRGNRFLQKMLAKGIGHMDEGINMIELATTEAELKAARVKYPSVKFSDVLHQGSHDNFDSLSTKILLETIDAAEILLSKDWGDFTPVQMQDVVKKVTHILRNLFINHPDQLPKKSNGTLGSIPTKSETGTA